MSFLQSHRLLLITGVIFFIRITFSAPLPVPAENEIYDFLDRVDRRGLITDYSDTYLPLNRNEVATYLKNIGNNLYQLNKIEKQVYQRFCSHFYPELGPQYINRDSDLFLDLENFLSNNISSREQHLLKYEKGNGFIWGDSRIKIANWTKNKLRKQNFTGQFLLRGSWENRLGGYIEFTRRKRLYGDMFKPSNFEQSNGKRKNYIQQQFQGGINYSDQTVELGFYQQPFLWGASRENNLSMSNKAESFPYFRFSAEIGWLDYSIIHGSLTNDSSSFAKEKVSLQNKTMAKNLAAQRVEISLLKDIQVGLNEFVIYCNRDFEPAYLVPFSFYFSTEHYLEDRDNVLMSFDIEANIIKNTEIYSSIFWDELKWSELGGEWWANKHAIQFGIQYSNYFLGKPVDLQTEYTAIRPWTYTHEYFNNNFTHDRKVLGFPFGPNSQLFYMNVSSNITPRLKMEFEYNNLQHGENTGDKHYGGEATSNYDNRLRKYDHATEWLMGQIKHQNDFAIRINYECLNDFYLYAQLEYNRIKYDDKEEKNFYTLLGIDMRI